MGAGGIAGGTYFTDELSLLHGVRDAAHVAHRAVVFLAVLCKGPVLEYGAKLSGATVHFVEADVDGGAIIMQKTVEVKYGDTPESLQERVLGVEHQILPLCVKLLCEGKVVKDGRQVRVLED